MQAPAILGFDTGFFRRFREGVPRAVDAWTAVQKGSAEGVVSCVTLYELEKLGLRGVIPQADADGIIRFLPYMCRVVWLDSLAPLSRGARLAHGLGMSMADSLILSALLDAGASTIYSTDSDFDRYEGPVEIVRL